MPSSFPSLAADSLKFSPRRRGPKLRKTAPCQVAPAKPTSILGVVAQNSQAPCTPRSRNMEKSTPEATVFMAPPPSTLKPWAGNCIAAVRPGVVTVILSATGGHGQQELHTRASAEGQAVLSSKRIRQSGKKTCRRSPQHWGKRESHKALSFWVVLPEGKPRAEGLPWSLPQSSAPAERRTHLVMEEEGLT